MYEENKCKICKIPIKKSKKYCSRKCSARDPEIHEKRKNKILEKYGTTCTLTLKNVREKVKKTIREKYGVEHFMKSQKVKEKIRKTNLLKYGVENPFSSEKIKEKIRKTNLRKYGTEYVMKNEKIKEKARQTCMKKYGVTNPAKNEKIQEKIRKTNLLKYGVENPLSSEKIKKKIKKTNLLKHGVENPFLSTKIQQKIKKTNLRKYGFINPIKNNEIMKKFQKTCLLKYGVDHFLKLPEIREKIKKTTLQNLGVEYPTQSKKVKEKIRKRYIKNYGVDNPNKKHIQNLKDWEENFPKIYHFFHGNLYEIAKYFNLTYEAVLGKALTKGLKEKYYSYLETGIHYFLKKNNIEYIRNSRKVLNNEYELDIYIPEYSFAIECNGSFWHSEIKGGKNQYYHLNKSSKCQEKGIRLLSIWEFLWPTKKNVYISIIENYLGKSTKKDAEKMKIFILSEEIACDFIQKNSVKNYEKSDLYIALSQHDEIFFVAAFNKNQDNKITINHMCSKIGYNIINAKEKILNHIVENYFPEKISIVLDNSHEFVLDYVNMGFEKKDIIFPDFLVTNDYVNFEKISNIDLNNIDFLEKPLSRWEILQYNGYDRIWDCGKTIVEKKC